MPLILSLFSTGLADQNISALNVPLEKGRVDLCIKHINFSGASQRTCICLLSLESLMGMGPPQSSFPGGEEKWWVGQVDTFVPPLTQHRRRKQKSQLPAFPWGGKELMEAPRVSGQAAWWEFSLVGGQTMKNGRGAWFVSCSDTNTESIKVKN